ncbi:SUMF1/EgtB/PvdO family nonheme iron enzyme [Chloroflexales bacterium ZM16-3]|nr:SUMF1/EgtB/PvdO family nonheme iron enzyme [Chloroflexales bacterium ZM16-3]
MRPGTYRIGGWERDAAAANLALDGFWIARTPVTVAQYAAFIEAGGYRDSRWWTPQGKDWLRGQKEPKPWRWRESPFNSRPQQAVTGVRWYEATAFCAWLSAQLARSLPRGYTLRLPTEAEWEAAAAYDAAWQRRSYPWGNDLPTARTAVFDRSWEEASPDVATCPAGAAVCGALDMVGTVWEWTVSSYQAYPERAHWLKEDFTTNDYDIPARGDSYYSSNVRCGARYRPDPVFDLVLDYDGGVRVCVSPRSR